MIALLKKLFTFLFTWTKTEETPALVFDGTRRPLDYDPDYGHDPDGIQRRVANAQKAATRSRLRVAALLDRWSQNDFVEVPVSSRMFLRRDYDAETLAFSEEGDLDQNTAVVLSVSLVSEEDVEAHVETLELADQISTPGLKWKDGIPVSHEHNADFTPVKARGRAGKNLGEFHKKFVSSTTFRRGWSNIVQALGTGRWTINPPNLDEVPEEDREEVEAECKERAKVIHSALVKNLYGGWKQFLHDSMYCLIAGFAIFEEVYADDGTIEKLAFIFPSSVVRWILDDDERELLAVEFERPDGTTYVIEAENLLIMSWDKFGNLFEGIAVMRSTIRWIEALEMFSHLELVAAELYGVPHTYVSRKNPESSRYDDKAVEKLTNLIDQAIAAENPIFVLPDNTEINTTSPAGAMPDFDTPKRFCLERILEPLKAEGSLIGIGQTGAFAARQDASDERISSSPYFAEFVAEKLNGSDNVPYTGTIKKMEDVIWNGPLIEGGDYCTIGYSIGELDDPGYMNRIAAARNANLITPDVDVENKVRENLDLPPIKAQPDLTSEPLQPVEEVRDAV